MKTIRGDVGTSRARDGLRRIGFVSTPAGRGAQEPNARDRSTGAVVDAREPWISAPGAPEGVWRQVVGLSLTDDLGLAIALVEVDEVTRQAIRRGTFTSVKDLVAAIETYIDGWNERCQPFAWTKTADEILTKETGGQRSSFTRH
jgi:hypothetical protein